ncbi:MAG: hypothetical protein M3337_03335 [Actinomycetota bacterium]|nr:hypothetical protein [Actinomycetota bacterium]
MAEVGHLVRRFVGMLSRRPPAPDDEAWAASSLSTGEQALWVQLGHADRRHSIIVARRFVALRPGATRPEIAGALLHDIGKLDADLGVLGRVAATVVGPRGARLRRYHDHERLGAELLADVGSAAETVDLVKGRGPAADDLRRADHI